MLYENYSTQGMIKLREIDVAQNKEKLKAFDTLVQDSKLYV